jgi:hypothetical protein
VGFDSSDPRSFSIVTLGVWWKKEDGIKLDGRRSSYATSIGMV